MRHLHTHKKVWLCRCLTLMLLLTVTVAGATGWAQALYLFSDGDGSAAVLDETHSGIDSVLLNLETGKSGENAMLTAGTLVTVRHGRRDHHRHGQTGNGQGVSGTHGHSSRFRVRWWASS